MTHSEAFLAAKYGGGGGFHTAFTNDYLLKHGNFFMKPTLHADGFVYPAISEAARYRIFKDVKCEVLDHPLNFAIKQEKPPTPPASASPSPSKSPSSPSDPRASPNILNGQSKNATWILGTQKLSWDDSTVASYNPDTKMFRCVVCNAVGFLSRIAEHYLGTHTSAKVFQCLHCPYSSTWSRCVRMHMAKHHGVPNAPPSLWKGQPLLEEIFQLLTSLKTSVDSQGRERLDPELCDKKFVCPKCPYTTDRRDLYLRHENIHKEDKPYHCYVCFKLFNRADHVKKHFLRIHRGHPYDISLVRRRPPRVSSSSSNNNNNNNGSSQISSSKSNNFSVDKLIANDKPPKVEEVELEEEDAMDLSRSGSDHPSKQQLRTFQCPSCEWEGVDSWCLRRHMNVHLKSFECPICDFKAGKAERLFTHVYRAHKKLVCTKCKFMTDLAQDFEVHIKECCVEIVVGNVFDKISEDSHNSSDDAADFKFDSPLFTTPFGKMFDPPSNRMDLKGSVSLLPLHNSISYCYPATTAQGLRPDDLGNLSGLNGKDLGNLSRLNGKVNGLNGKDVGNLSGLNGKVNGKNLGNLSGMNGKVNGLNGSVYGLPNFGINVDEKPTSGKQCKVDVKSELASPVQSSSDSGVTDLTADTVPPDDIACWHCGCEFADLSSLHTHTELHHRADDDHRSAPPKTKSSSSSRTKKFSCAVCNFRSDSQRTIIEHMRFHTGELVPCGACDFRTACDSALERHVLERHADGEKRCPHCGFLCVQKVPFIRHYRKCHHSKSCSRCRVIKRSLDPKLADDLSLLLETSKKQVARDVVRPYLHHNPYSRKSNAITPYSHCNAAMSRVAVAIPPSLQRTAANELADTSADDSMTRRQRKSSRKQTSPRKLLHHAKPGQISPRKSASKTNSRNAVQQGRNARSALHQNRNGVHRNRNANHQGRNAVCDSAVQRQTSPRKWVRRGIRTDTICDTNRRRKTPSVSHIRKKLLNKFANVPSGHRRCVMGHGRALAFRSGVNYVRHLYWCHHARRFRCHLCDGRFCHEYQVLLHRRSVHE